MPRLTKEEIKKSGLRFVGLSNIYDVLCEIRDELKIRNDQITKEEKRENNGMWST